MDNKLLTVDECAAFVKVHKMTIYRMINKGELPAIKVGKQFRVYEKDFHAYIDRNWVISSI